MRWRAGHPFENPADLTTGHPGPLPFIPGVEHCGELASGERVIGNPVLPGGAFAGSTRCVAPTGRMVILT
ncbi:hypothetical protein P3T36_000451 [Kitasatospora sp. MAP12-15]|uniref:hypothetical protein n=1 Tax=unclassified Kitasatospora TaxID=2633591 RepID=UPI00247B693F|nr:hypothetical protein [Kitasatospora sp. MAP12-44]